MLRIEQLQAALVEVPIVRIANGAARPTSVTVVLHALHDDVPAQGLVAQGRIGVVRIEALWIMAADDACLIGTVGGEAELNDAVAILGQPVAEYLASLSIGNRGSLGRSRCIGQRIGRPRMPRHEQAETCQHRWRAGSPSAPS